MAEQQGGAGVLGACGAGHWARGEAIFLCPPLFAERRCDRHEAGKRRARGGGRLRAELIRLKSHLSPLSLIARRAHTI